jgi:DNA-binding transcriptional ArsR family regulator
MNHTQNFNYRKTFPNDSKPKTPISKSNWWTPLWRGLAVEPTAKHFTTMGSAVWLYLYLLTFANRMSGNLFRRISTIAGDTGLSSRTISRWLKVLKDGGYVEVRQTGRSLQISITKWKPIKK